jgi:AraC-like DNA-binding protein
MDYAEFAADLPADRKISLSCAEENEEVLGRLGVTQEERQIGPGQFHSDMAFASTDQVGLFSDRFATAVSLYCEPPEDSVGFLIPRCAEGHFLANGVGVNNDKLAFVPNRSGSDIVASGLFGSDSIVIPQTRFIEMADALCPTLVPPTTTSVLEGNTTQLQTLRAALVELVNRARADPEQCANLVERTIAWMGESLNQRPPEVLACRTRKHIAKEAQAFINAHFTEAIRIEDLCRVTGVGVRTLQRAFREYFDVTITEYLKTVRLDSAFRALAAAHPAEHSVATIALGRGFSHLGRFSVMFRRRFGKSPSDTLAAVR